MAKEALETAHIFNRYGEAYRQAHGASLSTAQRRAMSAIELCRTAALGGHIERCDNCEHERVAYNSCRNRHCPMPIPFSREMADCTTIRAFGGAVLSRGLHASR